LPIELKVADATLTQTLGACVRCADLTLFQIRDATFGKSQPQANAHRIRQQNYGRVRVSQPGRGNPFHNTLACQTNKTLSVCDPNIPRGVLGDGIKFSGGHRAYGNEMTVFKVYESGRRGYPNSPAIVLKEGLDGIIQ
jgi:hypothetical protein